MATKGLQNAIIEIQKMMRDLPGMREAPDNLPDKPGAMPFICSWPGPGRWGAMSAGFLQGNVSIYVELHLVKGDAAMTMEEGMKYVELIPRTILANPTLNGAVDTVQGIDVTGLSKMTFGGIATMGYRWTVNVKI